jgi:diaminopropionate ammonia-lyase
MFLLNEHPDHRQALETADGACLSVEAARQVESYLSRRPEHAPTALHSLPRLARAIGVGSIHIKNESTRLGLGSFKALGGSYAVIRLVGEEAERRLGHVVDIGELFSPEVKAVAAGMTVGCATDGNHGRSVAAGAQLVGAHAAIFVHEGVSPERAAAIARFGAKIIRVSGSYDDAVAEAARVCAVRGWIVVSDTSWPGYERIPGLVMQGYTAMLSEAMRALPDTPTHVFLQAGVGGLAASVAGHFAVLLGERRPTIIVVEPARAACLLESMRIGHPVRIAQGEPTVMSMLECYEPSLIAWRVLTRCADAFMTVDEQDAIDIMRRLARPEDDDPVVVAGESGGVGLAGLTVAMRDADCRVAIGLDLDSRVFVINTEGATDPGRYQELVGMAATFLQQEARDTGTGE